MTSLRKPVRRTATIPYYGDVTIELAPEGVRYREKGRRRWLLIPHATAFGTAARLEAARLVVERKQARKEARAIRASARHTI